MEKTLFRPVVDDLVSHIFWGEWKKSIDNPHIFTLFGTVGYEVWGSPIPRNWWERFKWHFRRPGLFRLQCMADCSTELHRDELLPHHAHRETREATVINRKLFQCAVADARRHDAVLSMRTLLEDCLCCTADNDTRVVEASVALDRWGQPRPGAHLGFRKWGVLAYIGRVPPGEF